ncbi:MAG: molecular chaperone TorD family protein [Geminicoccaceae bacterium]|jgi:TorA maturation chaperone TorD|nr:molecular chaperone TorD family protein [Geminicoccaceae bacterium]
MSLANPVPWSEVAEDLGMLALLHDREPTAALLDDLRRHPIQGWLGLHLGGADGARLLDLALADLPAVIDRAVVDELAADYVDIYLVHGLHAAPAESPWLDREHLVCQEPMFEVREWYAHYGLAAENWRRRSDDHLVLQLGFLAELARRGTPASILDIGRFLDRHLLRWLPDFAQRVVQRARTPYFAGLAQLTVDYAEVLRLLVVEVTGEPRRRIEADPKRAAAAPVSPQPYLPGAQPGW